MNKYSDTTLGNNAPFVNLPVETFNKITWRGGDDKLSALIAIDPGIYLGEFRSMVSTTGTPEKPSIVFPALPWNVVTRKAGRETYQRYSTTEMLFRPIAARARFVKYERSGDGKKVKNDTNGRYRIAATSSEFPGKGSGFDPQKEIFGIVLDTKGVAVSYACLVLDNWNAYISYNNSAAKFEALKVPEGQLAIYKIGTRGEVVGGEVIQKGKKFGEGTFVEIEPLDLHTPMLFDITKEFDDMWEAAQAWKDCPRWNATGRVTESATPMVDMAQELASTPPEDEVPY